MKIMTLVTTVALLATGGPAFAHPTGPNRRPGPQAKVERYEFSMDSSSGRLGIQVQSMTEALRAYFGAPKGQGVLVADVPADSPAKQAGLRAGDVLLEVEGKTIGDIDDIYEALSGKKEGDAVRLIVLRDKKRVELQSKLAAGFGAFAFGPDGMKFSFDGLDPKAFKFFRPGRAMVGVFGADEEALEKLEKRIEELEKRLEKLENK